MVKIRLAQTGKKHQRSYRIVITDSSAKRNGKNIEIIGNYNPNIDPPEIKIDKERYEYWINQGAQPTEAVRKLVK